MTLPRITSYTFGIAAAVALALAAAWFLYPRSSGAATPAGKEAILYWTPVGFYDTQRPLVDEFMHRNPGYHVTMGSAATRDDTGDPTRFLLGVAGGVPPDVIFFARFAISEWASRGVFENLEPFLARDADRPDGIRRENYFELAWAEGVYRGTTYAIPQSVDTRAMFYALDPLIRGGFTYQADDPEVLAGRVKAGDARPPKTWEELALKRLHVRGAADGGGRVRLAEWVRRAAVNEGLPDPAPPIDLASAGVRAGDVIVLIAPGNLFRGRIARIVGRDEVQVDLAREQRAGLTGLPLTGECEIKIFDQDGYVPRLTRFDPQTGLMTDAAFIPMFGNSWLYLFGWLNGAEFVREEGSVVTLNEPAVVEALQWLSDCYDAMGGYEKAYTFQQGGGSGSSNLDAFIGGKVAMRIDNDFFATQIYAFRPTLRFGVVPPPLPAKRIAAGHGSFGWAGGWAYAIPTTARNKEGAWELIRWLAGLESGKLQAELEASIRRAQGHEYFPTLEAERRLQAWVHEKYILNNTGFSPYLIQAYNAFVEILPLSKHRPVTPAGQKLWNEHVRATNAALNHTELPYEALTYGDRQVQESLDRILSPPTGPVVNWRYVVILYLIGVAAVFGGLILHQERLRRRQGGDLHRGWVEGYIAASPWLFGFILLGAGPLLFSIIISFCQYDVVNPARFVGLRNYMNLVGRHLDPVSGRMVWNDPIFWKSLANTLFMVIQVPLAIVLGLAIALLLDTRVRGLHVYRTIFYLPAIVPAVASFILWLWVYEPTRGMLNSVLRGFGLADPPAWLQDPAWAKPALILMGLWGVGASMIIWLAGLKDIPEQMYEAAAIDGAGSLRRFRHITLPLLSPYVFFNMVMGLIAIFQVFEIAYIMTDGGPADATMFYAFKLFNEAFRYLSLGAASAMAWLLFLVVLAVTLFQLWLARRWVHYGG